MVPTNRNSYSITGPYGYSNTQLLIIEFITSLLLAPLFGLGSHVLTRHTLLYCSVLIYLKFLDQSIKQTAGVKFADGKKSVFL